MDTHLYESVRSHRISHDRAIKIMGEFQTRLIEENAGIRFTITKETESSFYDIFKLSEELNVNKIYISHLVYSGRGKKGITLKLENIQGERRRIRLFAMRIRKKQILRIGKKSGELSGSTQMQMGKTGH